MATSSPVRRNGSILNFAPCSSPTSRSRADEDEDEESLLLDRGTMYPDRLTCLLAVAMGRDGRHWKREQPRVAGRRALWRVAMVGWRTNDSGSGNC